MPKDNADYLVFINSRADNPPKRLYKYTTLSTALTILSCGKLRFQSPLRYNDPFDSQWDPFWPLTNPHAKERERSVLEQAISDPESWPADIHPHFQHALQSLRAKLDSMPEDERAEAISHYVEEIVNDDEQSRIAQRHLLDQRRRLRVLCLSEESDSILMWSHYAEQHKGVVLGFDVRRLEDGLQRPLERMNYSEDVPRVIDLDAWHKSVIFGTPTPGWEGKEREFALTKHSGWAYEREWRFVFLSGPGSLGMHSDLAFPADALAELLVGDRADSSVFVELLALARGLNPEVEVARMMKHFEKFALERWPIDL